MFVVPFHFTLSDLLFVLLLFRFLFLALVSRAAFIYELM